jgi:hypothetical protein
MIILDDQIPQNRGIGYHENYFAHLIQGDDRLDLMSFLKDILIVSPEWDEPSRKETFHFFYLVKK